MVAMYLLWFSLLFCGLKLSEAVGFSSEFEAIKFLFGDEWQKYNVPFSENGTAKVYHMLMINRIISLDLEEQVLSIDAKIHIQYTDKRLAWDPLETSDDLSMVRVPSDMIWKPDVILYNDAGTMDGYTVKLLALLAHDGTVINIQPAQLKAYCKTPRTVPVGSKITCSLKFGSWAYDGFTLDLQTLYDGKTVDLSSYDAGFNRDWELTSAEVSRNMETFPCCPEPYVDLEYNIELTRRN